jgi:hypothetical protein
VLISVALAFRERLVFGSFRLSTPDDQPERKPRRMNTC